MGPRLVVLAGALLVLLAASSPGAVARRQDPAPTPAAGASAGIPMAPLGLEPVYDNGAGFVVYGLVLEGESMAPTLASGERLLVDASAYRSAPPVRGDVVVFYPPGGSDGPFTKRVVGLPGERVRFRDGAVLVDGVALAEGYTEDRTECVAAPGCDAVVPEGAVYVLGDNRNNSSDSRSFGPVPLEAVVGRAWFAHDDPHARPLDGSR